MMISQPHVLMVDDDQDLCELLGEYLSRNGLKVSTARDAPEMRAFLARQPVDLILLEVMMPGEDGFSVGRGLHTLTSAPFIMLTACTSLADRVSGLELGADDYVTKPFEPRELLARIRVVLRRAGNRCGDDDRVARSIAFAHWELDTVQRELRGEDGRRVALSNSEFRLLMVFLHAPRRVLSRDQLVDLARGRGVEVYDRSIDLLVSRLRQKLCEDPRSPRLIRTVRGEGYLFNPVAAKTGPASRSVAA